MARHYLPSPDDHPSLDLDYNPNKTKQEIIETPKQLAHRKNHTFKLPLDFSTYSSFDSSDTLH